MCDFHEQMEGLELGAVLEILKNQGEKKGIIEIDTKIIRPTPYGIEKLSLYSILRLDLDLLKTGPFEKRARAKRNA